MNTANSKHWKEKELKKNFNWTEVSTPSKSLPAGGYVIEIQDVIDNEDWEQIEVVYNIVEGEYKDIYKNMAPDDDWKHKFAVKYDDNGTRRFKAFLDELEHDNPSFSIERWQVESDPLKFVGLKMGALLGEWRSIYTNADGEDRASYKLILSKPLTIEQVRNDDFYVPDPKYKRGTDEMLWLQLRADATGGTSSGTATQGDIYDGVPF